MHLRAAFPLMLGLSHPIVRALPTVQWCFRGAPVTFGLEPQERAVS
jgi:hypothetical protein